MLVSVPSGAWQADNWQIGSTGAGSGIGRTLAHALAARGANIVLADVDTAALQTVSDSLEAIAVPTDVATPEAVEALARTADNARLVCLNAGIVGTSLGAPWEVAPEDWTRRNTPSLPLPSTPRWRWPTPRSA